MACIHISMAVLAKDPSEENWTILEIIIQAMRVRLTKQVPAVAVIPAASS